MRDEQLKLAALVPRLISLFSGRRLICVVSIHSCVSLAKGVTTFFLLIGGGGSLVDGINQRSQTFV